MAFTLEPNRWHGWQMIPGYAGERCVPFFCPCWMNAVTPQKSGKGLLKLDVWVTGCAEGINNGEANLKVIHRGENYLIAQMLFRDAPEASRSVVISHIEFEWVRRFCPELWASHPVERTPSFGSGSISFYLDDIFRPTPEWTPDLCQEAVTWCALRFDGEKWDNELNRKNPHTKTYGNLALLHEKWFPSPLWKLHPDPLINWGEFFWLQRSEKWTGLQGDAARLMAWLFTQLHNQPVPFGYENVEYAERYARLKPQAAKLASEWADQLASHAT